VTCTPDLFYTECLAELTIYRDEMLAAIASCYAATPACDSTAFNVIRSCIFAAADTLSLSDAARAAVASYCRVCSPSSIDACNQMATMQPPAGGTMGLSAAQLTDSTLQAMQTCFDHASGADPCTQGQNCQHGVLNPTAPGGAGPCAP
jgi:hypothetical protein